MTMTPDKPTNARAVRELYYLAVEATQAGKPRAGLLYRLAHDLADLAASPAIADADAGDGAIQSVEVSDYLDTAGLDCFRLAASVLHDTTDPLIHADH